LDEEATGKFCIGIETDCAAAAAGAFDEEAGCFGVVLKQFELILEI